ncbi:hypothetical protein ABID19_002107 [Mesorhizobium robiniae]|uniref:Uncharacterized protein n=1 Tax=Mesorhizobium robiniae TaxID=559315 RepID=A0ABV2GM07_9HYPH
MSGRTEGGAVERHVTAPRGIWHNTCGIPHSLFAARSYVQGLPGGIL